VESGGACTYGRDFAMFTARSERENNFVVYIFVNAVLASVPR
jgi:hypothetical protein